MDELTYEMKEILAAAAARMDDETLQVLLQRFAECNEPESSRDVIRREITLRKVEQNFA